MSKSDKPVPPVITLADLFKPENASLFALSSKLTEERYALSSEVIELPKYAHSTTRGALSLLVRARRERNTSFPAPSSAPHS